MNKRHRSVLWQGLLAAAPGSPALAAAVAAIVDNVRARRYRRPRRNLLLSEKRAAIFICLRNAPQRSCLRQPVSAVAASAEYPRRAAATRISTSWPRRRRPPRNIHVAGRGAAATFIRGRPPRKRPRRYPDEGILSLLYVTGPGLLGTVTNERRFPVRRECSWGTSGHWLLRGRRPRGNPSDSNSAKVLTECPRRAPRRRRDPPRRPCILKAPRRLGAAQASAARLYSGCRRSYIMPKMAAASSRTRPCTSSTTSTSATTRRGATPTTTRTASICRAKTRRRRSGAGTAP